MIKGKVAAPKKMPSQKENWQNDDPSEVLQKRYKDELLEFKAWAKNEEACQERLIACLGWVNNGKNSTFKCPSCSHKAARSRLKKEGKGKERSFRLIFECKECGKSPSPRSETIMKGSSIPLGFWFLCIYAIGLMNGKVPWKYLNVQRVEFNSDTETINVLGRDLQRIISKILVTCKDHHERIFYAQLVKLEFDDHTPLESYLSWYESKKWVPWRIAFKKDPYTLKMALSCHSHTHSVNEVEDVYICSDREIFAGEWLLLAEINSDEKVGNVKWFYVSRLYNITDGNLKSDGYSKIAVFLKDDKNNNNFPFELGKKFRRALRSHVKPKVLKSLLLNSVKIPPNTVFEKMADDLSS